MLILNMHHRRIPFTSELFENKITRTKKAFLENRGLPDEGVDGEKPKN